jgi:hypothetical protein
MPFYTKNVRQLERDVNRISNNVRQTQWLTALKSFRLNGLTKVETIGETEETFSYTPEERIIIMGDASPASCNSTPMVVDYASSEEFKGFTVTHEVGYEVCLKDCKTDNTLISKVTHGEYSSSVVLLNHLYNKFWYGNPELMQFGLLNHPLTEIIDSPNNGRDGSSSFSSKSNNQVMKEIRNALKYMIDPRVIMSEQAFENSMGDANTGDNQTGCDTRSECVKSLLSKQSNIRFDGEIEFMSELDNRQEFDGDDIMLIYDADSVAMTSSGVIYLSAASVSTKVVLANRLINTAGLRINYADSVKIIRGI